MSSVELVLPSEIKLIDVAHCASEKMAEVAGFDEDEALSIALAVREAVINAILHGNRQDPARQVHIRLTAGTGCIEASVRDQGDGFDPDATPDPTEDENLLRTSGRGLLLIRAFVDELKFRRPADGGTEVMMIKKLT